MRGAPPPCTCAPPVRIERARGGRALDRARARVYKYTHAGLRRFEPVHRALQERGVVRREVLAVRAAAEEHEAEAREPERRLDEAEALDDCPLALVADARLPALVHEVREVRLELDVHVAEDREELVPAQATLGVVEARRERRRPLLHGFEALHRAEEEHRRSQPPIGRAPVQHRRRHEPHHRQARAHLRGEAHFGTEISSSRTRMQ